MKENGFTLVEQRTGASVFRYREDYLLFGLLVQHGLMGPQDEELLVRAQLGEEPPRSLLQLLSDCSGLTPKERSDIHELLTVLATPALRDKLPQQLPEVETLVNTLEATQRLGISRMQTEFPTQAGTVPLPADTIGAGNSLATTLTADELTRINSSRKKGGLIGRNLYGHVVLDRIGSGGQGEVYLAKQLSLGRYVALKELHIPEHASAERFLATFQREAQTLARMNHARIVKIFEIFQTEGKAHFTMEYVEGKTLKELIARSAGPLPLEMVANFACQAASALARTSEDGIVHCDIKPANILIDENGDLKIVDFGLASAAAEAGRQEGFAGTPQYASPEQCASKPITAAADQYSLGVTLYLAATGKLPFNTKSLEEMLRMHLEDAPPPPSSVNEQLPPDVDRILLKMLAKDPAARFANFNDCFAAWQKVLSLSSGIAPAGTDQLLGETLLRLSRGDKKRLLNQSLALAGLWLLMIVAALAGDAMLRQRGLGWVLDASGRLGTGTLVFSLCCIFYVALARRGWLPTVGSLRLWLHVHIATAIPSVILLMVHSGNFLRGITPGPPAARPILTVLVALVLCVTAVSGSVGLLIFRELRRQVQLGQLQLRGNRAHSREAMAAVLGAQLLSGWRLVHYPLAVFFILLSILHVFVAIRYGGNQ